MIRDHIGTHANTARRGAVLQIEVRTLTSKFFGDGVIKQGICGGCRFGISGELLDALRSLTSLPNTDQPKHIESAAGEGIEFLIGDLIETMNMALVDPR